MERITYLSSPADVSMADRWFEIAELNHFWIRRRFEVFHKLAGGIAAGAKSIAEVGCGHGLLQREVELAYKKEVAGFDLNDFALQRNISAFSKLYCYDIHRKAAEFGNRFDFIFLFDVLEHIDDEDSFLRALLFHLAPGGRLAINVPAGQWAFSEYDRAAGHVRRYSINSLRSVALRNNLRIEKWTYWGFSLLPILLARKVWLAARSDKSEIISNGFASRTRLMNRCLGVISGLEAIPQRIAGTSLMAVLQQDSAST